MDCAGVQGEPQRRLRRPPLEKTIVANGLAAAKAMGWWAVKIHGGPFQLSGLPDVLAIKGGRAAWAEFKRPGEEATKLQSHRLRELSLAGCACAVVHSVGEYREFLANAEVMP